MKEKKLYNTVEAAEYLNIHKQTVRRYARERKIANIRLPGNKIRFTEEALNHFLKTREIKEKPEKLPKCLRERSYL